MSAAHPKGFRSPIRAAAIAALCGAIVHACGGVDPSSESRPEQSPGGDEPSAASVETVPQPTKALRDRLGSWNANLTHLLSVERRSTATSAEEVTFVLAHAIREDSTFHGSLEDEAFGVFVIDSKTGEIQETLGYLPTCRWLDCTVSIDDVWEDSIAIAWQGSTHGDQAGRQIFRTYGWSDWRVLPREQAGPIATNSGETALVERLGSGAVSSQLVWIGEGFCAPGAVLFEGTPNQAEVMWLDSTRAKPAVVRINGRGGDWTTPQGVHVGSPLPELEALRGAPITFSGFGWDYGGGTGWEEASGSVRLQLDYGPDDLALVREHAQYAEIVGDREVRSDHPVVRMMQIQVSDIVVSWGYPQTELPCG